MLAFDKAVYISYGEQTKMYTLRVLEYKEDEKGHVHTLESYIKNLSVDPEKAKEKAIQYASLHNIEMVLTECTNKTLDEITRRKSEEIAQERKERIENAQRLKEEESQNLVILFEENFQGSTFTFGKYEGCEFSEIRKSDPKYIKYILGNSKHTLPMEYPKTIVDACINGLYNYIQEHGYPADPEENSEYIGVKGDRITIDVVVRNKFSFDTAWCIKTMYKFQDKDDNVFVTFYSGSAWKLDIGDTATIKGTVDKHQVHEDIKQTHLKRVKVQ